MRMARLALPHQFREEPAWKAHHAASSSSSTKPGY
jgi:hypothetical protein